jgi:hypothetical protein
MPDSELTSAARRLLEIEQELSRLCPHGDKAQPDFQSVERKRSNLLELLAAMPASTREGMIAKASSLLLPHARDDFNQHCEIAASLARDVLTNLRWR